ncbi:MAG: transcription termination/antitermination protein NusG [Patescibacteria group bacterium]|nr:transcription termination/antitermination protein NusG [Patescibacteria group bacterium]
MNKKTKKTIKPKSSKPKEVKAVKPKKTKQDIVKEQEKKDAKKAQAENHIIINKDDKKKANWFVVHTYSGHEQKVAAGLKQRAESMNLTDYILEILIPTQNKIQIKKGEKHSIKEKLFPGYMLVKLVLTDDSWLAVRTTQGVTGFVGIGNKPTPLPESEVKNIMKFMQMEAPKYKTSFSIGEAVKIIEGPFADFLGSVESLDNERGKIKVLVSIFGRETPVELDFLQVQKI